MKPVLVLLPLLAAVACGGGDDSKGASKADFITKAEQVCTRANADQGNLKTPTSAGELSAYVDAIVKIADTSTTALADLEPPEADKAALQEHVLGPLEDQLKRGKEYAEKVRTASKANDTIALVKLFSDPPNKTVADLGWMRDYGFKECVEAADTSG